MDGNPIKRMKSMRTLIKLNNGECVAQFGKDMIHTQNPRNPLPFIGKRKFDKDTRKAPEGLFGLFDGSLTPFSVLGMEKPNECSQSKKARVSWKDINVSCLREVSINGREGGSLKAISWKNVAETLEKTHNFIADQRQMKNHYDYLKGKYGAWSKLVNRTGNIYDPSTNSFRLSERNGKWKQRSYSLVFTILISFKLFFSNKYVEKLRSAPLPFSDLCVQLFDGVASTGIGSWGPTSLVPNPTCIAPPSHEQQSSQTFSTRVAPPSQEQQSSRTFSTHVPPQTQETQIFFSFSISKKKRKRIQPSTSVNDEEVSKVVTSVQNALDKQHVESGVSDVGACIEKLEKLGWESSLYEMAFHLFSLGGDYKKIWLCLKEEKCEAWVRIRQSVAQLGQDQVMDRKKLTLIVVFSSRIERVRDNTSALSGHAYTQELLNGSSTQCQELMRLSRHAYVLLCNYFKEKNWVRSSRYVSVEEKMAIFLTIIGHNELFRVVKRRFQHSTSTINKCFHEVLRGMMEFAREVGAIGALDGTLIHAVMPASQQARYRGRGECYQNVLGVCDFNMIFTFVWAGWEGIAHDSRVLTEVAYSPTLGFPFPPPNKYYLCDVVYTNAQEKFNHAHAQLRNVIERAYGVLKARFPILKQMTPYPFAIQKDVVIACFAIHNFIRKYNIQDQLFMECDENMFTNEEHDKGIEAESIAEEGIEETQWGPQSNEYLTNLHDQIAN
ncbi:hypothetical protein OSB04_017446, partial [Centaurea solstitialis]